MNKIVLREVAKMSSYVEEASKKVSWLVSREARGPGDIPNAMRRLARRYGVSYHALWALRYRKPSDMLVSLYSRICEAHEAECERQRDLLNHELSISRAKNRVGTAVIRTSAALAGEKDGVD